MVAIRSPAFGFGWDDDTPWGEGVSADKSGVEGGAINSRRCVSVRGMWGSIYGYVWKVADASHGFSGGRKRLGEGGGVRIYAD